jgi:hypothetical protein
MATPTKEPSIEQKGDHGAPPPTGDNEESSINKVAGGVPIFQWSHLWQQPIINPINLKSYTLPIFNLNNPYSRSFHLSWREFPFFISRKGVEELVSRTLCSRFFCGLLGMVRFPASHS